MTCRQCNGDYPQLIHATNIQRMGFCTLQCYRASKSEMFALKNCEVCGEVIVKQRYRSWANYRKLRTCDRQCGGEIRRNQYEPEKDSSYSHYLNRYADQL